MESISNLKTMQTHQGGDGQNARCLLTEKAELPVEMVTWLFYWGGGKMKLIVIHPQPVDYEYFNFLYNKLNIS